MGQQLWAESSVSIVDSPCANVTNRGAGTAAVVENPNIGQLVDG